MAIRAARPPYLLRIGDVWRVVIPVAGKLAPIVPDRRFTTGAAARKWLASEDGRAEIERAATFARGKARGASPVDQGADAPAS